jgi:hypothetical protein
MRGPSLAGKAEAVGEEEDDLYDEPRPSLQGWMDQRRLEEAGSHRHIEEHALDMSYEDTLDRSILEYGPSSEHDSETASEAEKKMDALRRELSLAIGGKQKLEASEQRWRREAEQSVMLGEQMKLLVVELLGAVDGAAAESKELRKEVVKLRKENTKLSSKSVSADIRAECAETRLEELKEASRAAIKRNESLMAQLEACRISMQSFKNDKQAKRAQSKELATERQRAAAAEKLVTELRNEKQELEAARAAMLRELDRASKREEKFQEAVVAHCTLANELREYARKLEGELRDTDEEMALEGKELWREHAALLARFGVSREATMPDVVRLLLSKLAQASSEKVIHLY